MPKLDRIVRQLAPQERSQASVEAEMSRALSKLINDADTSAQQRTQGVLSSLSALQARLDRSTSELAKVSEGGTRRLAEALAAVLDEVGATLDGIAKSVERLGSESAEQFNGLRKDVQGLPAPVVNVDAPDLEDIVLRVQASLPDVRAIVRDEIGKIPAPQQRPGEWTFEVERDPSNKIRRVTARAE